MLNLPVGPVILLTHAVIGLAGAWLCSRSIDTAVKRSRPLDAITATLPILFGAAGVYLATGIGPTVTFLISVAVTSLLFAGGVSMLLAPRPAGEIPAARNPLSAQILTAAVAIVLVGFSSRLTAASVVSLGILGIVAMDLLRSDAAPEAARDHSSAHASSPLPILELLVALLPATVVLFSAYQFARGTHEILPNAPVEIGLINMLCPALLVPTIRSAGRAANQGRLSDAMATCAGVAMASIGILVPAAVALDYALQWHSGNPPALASINPVTCRLDGALLLVGGLALVGMRFEMLRPERWVAIIHIILYGAYLLLSTLLRAWF